MKLTNEQVFELMNKGIWMQSPGLIWRNVVDGDTTYGLYQSYGEFPNNVRTCKAFTLKEINDCDWTIWFEPKPQEPSA